MIMSQAQEAVVAHLLPWRRSPQARSSQIIRTTIMTSTNINNHQTTQPFGRILLALVLALLQSTLFISSLSLIPTLAVVGQSLNPLDWSPSIPVDLLASTPFSSDATSISSQVGIVSMFQDRNYHELWYLISNEGLIQYNSSCLNATLLFPQPSYTTSTQPIDQDPISGRVVMAMGDTSQIYSFIRDPSQPAQPVEVSPLFNRSMSPLHWNQVYALVAANNIVYLAIDSYETNLYLITYNVLTNEVSPLSFTECTYSSTSPRIFINPALTELLITGCQSQTSKLLASYDPLNNVTTYLTVPKVVEWPKYARRHPNGDILIAGPRSLGGLYAWNTTSNEMTLLFSSIICAVNFYLMDSLLLVGCLTGAQGLILIQQNEEGWYADRTTLLPVDYTDLPGLNDLAIDRSSKRLVYYISKSFFLLNGHMRTTLLGTRYCLGSIGSVVISPRGDWIANVCFSRTAEDPVYITKGLVPSRLSIGTDPTTGERLCPVPQSMDIAAERLFIVCSTGPSVYNVSLLIVDEANHVNPLFQLIDAGSIGISIFQIWTTDDINIIFIKSQVKPGAPVLLQRWDLTDPYAPNAIQTLNLGNSTCTNFGLTVIMNGAIYGQCSSTGTYDIYAYFTDLITEPQRIFQTEFSLQGLTAVSSRNELWISGQGMLFCFNVLSQSITQTIPYLTSLAQVNAFTGLVYFITGGQLRVWDPVSQEALKFTIPQCSIVTSIALHQQSGILVVSCFSGLLTTVSDYFSCPSGSGVDFGVCTACDIGAFSPPINQNSTHFSTCSQCPLGSIAPVVGTAECHVCETGRYQDLSLGQVCEFCQQGRFQNQTGQLDCYDCDPGTYSSYLGASFCSDCEAGYYQPDSGTGSCLSCAPGYYTSDIHSTRCFPCDPGSISSTLGSVSCEPCPAGTYQAHQAAGICLSCQPGHYSSTNSSTSCQSCEPGRYSPDIGFTTCQVCSAGTYSDAANRTACLPCAKHTYSNEIERTSECDSCPDGYEQLNSGQTSCVQCTLGTYSLSGSSCQPCALNTYSPMQGAPCQTCSDDNQDGLYCSGGLAYVKPGYWAYQIYNETSKLYIFQTTPCSTAAPCPGSPLQVFGNSSGNTTSGQSITYCEYPRLNSADNWLCGACSGDLIAWGSTCDTCASTNGPILFGLIVFGLFLVTFLLKAGASSAGHIGILLFFIQTSALELGPVVSWLSWMQFVNFGSHSIRTCLAPLAPLQQQVLTLCIPLILAGLLLSISLVHWLVARFFGGGGRSNPVEASWVANHLSSLAMEFSWSRYIGGWMNILLFCYTSVSVAVVESLHCVEVAPDVTLLFSMPTVHCDSSAYHAFLPIVYVWLILYVIGLPLSILIFLNLRRHKSHRNMSLGDSNAKLNNFDLRWGSFYLGYNERAWFWITGLLFRRFLFAVTSVLLSTQLSAKYALFVALNFFSLVLHSIFQPFHTKLLNNLDSASYFLLVCLSVLLSITPPPFPVYIQVFIFLVVVPASGGLLLWCLHIQFRTLHTRLTAKSMSPSSVPSPTQPSSSLAVHPPIHSFDEESKGDDPTSSIQMNPLQSMNGIHPTLDETPNQFVMDKFVMDSSSETL